MQWIMHNKSNWSYGAFYLVNTLNWPIPTHWHIKFIYILAKIWISTVSHGPNSRSNAGASGINFCSLSRSLRCVCFDINLKKNALKIKEKKKKKTDEVWYQFSLLSECYFFKHWIYIINLMDSYSWCHIVILNLCLKITYILFQISEIDWCSWFY